MAQRKQRLYLEAEYKVDRISLLPDEVLVSILYLLSLKEATWMSILNHRWRDLLRYFLTHLQKLNIDGKFMLINKPLSLVDLHQERSNYITWVDGLISINKSPTFEQFGLVFNLDRSNQQTIDRWVRFALSRRVEKLELRFTEAGSIQRNRGFQYYYIFPHHHHHVTEFKFLKRLSTMHVSMNGEFVKELVRNCRHLQHLSITKSDILYVEIIQPSPSFQSLELSMCYNLISLVIRDSNIVTLKVQMVERRRLVLENVPLLSELWCFPSLRYMSMEDIRHMFSSVLPQLRLFKLYTILGEFDEEDTKRFSCAVELSNLKHLVVVGRDMSLRPMINLLNASPRLERFVLELLYQGENREARQAHSPPSMGIRNLNRSPRPRRAQSLPSIKNAKKYPYLKEMEIVGYHDVQLEDVQLEMVMYLVENGTALQKIKVDSRVFTFDMDNTWEFIPRQQKVSSEITRHFRKYIPSRIDLEIL